MKGIGGRSLLAFVLWTVNQAMAETVPSPLLTIDQHRASIVERIVSQWGDHINVAVEGVNREELREMLFAMRADHLLAASVAGSVTGVRDVLAGALMSPESVKLRTVSTTKALGDSGDDVAYSPVTPCRLVETRPGTFPAVYQGAGAFTSNEIRTYTVQGGNGVCLSQLPAALNPTAVQLQVFGIPINGGSSGDVEVLPQGATFGSTATLVYLGNMLLTSASTTARINLANNQISVQVRGGGAQIAIDVVGYFKRPGNYSGTHTITGQYATDSGGFNNSTTGFYSTVGGGFANAATQQYATVAGGGGNTAGGHASAVGGGVNNQSNGPQSTVAGGVENATTGLNATVGGGGSNTATGEVSTVPGGAGNTAGGFGSVAVGVNANALHDNSFVWGAWSGGLSATSFRTSAFQIHGEAGLDIEYGARRADGGGSAWVFIGNGFVGQAIATYTGGFLSTGGVWTNNSDRDRKTALRPIDPQQVLRKVAELPITTWRYREEAPDVWHMGPMAQDFRAAFELGMDNKSIGTIDASGVSLAAIQGLNQVLQQKDARIAALEQQIGDVQRELAALTALIVDRRPALPAGEVVR